MSSAGQTAYVQVSFAESEFDFFARKAARSQNPATGTRGEQTNATDSEIVERRRSLRPRPWRLGDSHRTNYSVKPGSWSRKGRSSFCSALMHSLSPAEAEVYPSGVKVETCKATFSAEPESPGISPLLCFCPGSLTHTANSALHS